MEKKYKKEEIRGAIDPIIEILRENFKSKTSLSQKSNKLNSDQIYGLMTDLKGLFNIYADLDVMECGKIAIKEYIRLINLLIALEIKQDRLVEYHNQLENAYKIAGRVSLEHFIIYYEWYEKDKLYETRYEILQPYVYYLNKMCWDRTFEGMIVNLPSGYGKSRLVRLYEAFRLGTDPGGTFLALCSNDDLIKGQSRSVIDIIKNPRYGDVFPNLKWSEKDRGFFLKETDGEWKLKQCSMIASYYAKSTMSNVVGIRANLSIDIDDLYADYKEALDENTNKYYLNKYQTVWAKRYVQNLRPQVIVTGTMWSATDFLTKLIQLWEKESEFIKHPKLKYTRISKDGKRVIIQVPALDYETGESTCPKLKTTEELLKEKDSMEQYLWETNFQQRPVSPAGMYFDYTNLRTYETLPVFEEGATTASLDPARKGKDYVTMTIYKQKGGDYYYVDCLYDQKSMTELHDRIVDKIIEHKIVSFVIENNTDTSLKDLLEMKLRERGYYGCTIYEKYNTVVKETRIMNFKDTVIKAIVFPAKHLYGVNTEMGKSMENFTGYILGGQNKHDDIVDCHCIHADQIILGNAIPQKAVAIRRI